MSPLRKNCSETINICVEKKNIYICVIFHFLFVSAILSKASEPLSLSAFNLFFLILQFPVCDKSHIKHNELTGDNVGPLILKKKTL